LLEISGSHSNIISDSYVFHYGNELVSRTGSRGVRHFVTASCDQRYPFAVILSKYILRSHAYDSVQLGTSLQAELSFFCNLQSYN